MTTKSNQTEVDHQEFLRFPMSLSRDCSLSMDWSLLSMLDMSLISKEWHSKQSNVDFVLENQLCSESTTEKKTESKKDGTSTDWLKMFTDALTPTSASVPITCVPAPICTPSTSRLARPSRPARRSRPSRIPKEKVYVDQYNDFDVIFGRGGKSNHHPGNKVGKSADGSSLWIINRHKDIPHSALLATCRPTDSR